jgi:hypothetical protein
MVPEIDASILVSSSQSASLDHHPDQRMTVAPPNSVN